MHYKVCVLLSAISWVSCSFIVNPGPTIVPTKGAVWPMPQLVNSLDDYYTVSSPGFQFEIVGYNCSIVQHAVDRYFNIITTGAARAKEFQSKDLKHGPILESSGNHLGDLNLLKVDLLSSCDDNEYPHMDMDESYKLEIGNNNTIRANSVWGLLKGMETFVQLIYLNDNYSHVINATQVSDFARFPYRGLLLDTSRHFLPLKVIFENLDAMACNKLNVFHWHIVDDQSFPYKSIAFPEMSKKGAYHPHLKVYTQEDIKEVIKYARLRGIRVIPEFDTPGHTRSWGEGIKNILSACYEDGKPNGMYGPMNPTEPTLYTFIKAFFEEIIQVFPDKYLHLGGDEVDFECWKNNPEILKIMEQWNITGNFRELENIYFRKLLSIVGTQKETIVWQEVFFNNINISKETLVHVWDPMGYILLHKVVHSGQPALFSTCWYLDNVGSGGDWKKFYTCDPYYFVLPTDKHLIKGGEACMWGEQVNQYNAVSRIWPRASATAEKLWSKSKADNTDSAAHRLEEHTCRMNLRGISAQPPNGAGFCLI